MSSLLGLASPGRPSRRRRRPPRPIPPTNIQRSYLQALLERLAPARELVQRQLVPVLPRWVREADFQRQPVRLDDVMDDLAVVFDNIRLEYQRIVAPRRSEELAVEVATEVSRHNRKQVDRQIRALLDLDVFRSEPWLEVALKGFARENVALITSIPERYFNEIEQRVLRGLRTGERAESITKTIEKRYGVAQNRAALIARDQVGKLNGQLTRQRHLDIGVTSYIWHNVGDERVRGRPGGKNPSARHSHWEREGKSFSYEKPPPDGHPGEAIRCRCWAEPVL